MIKNLWNNITLVCGNHGEDVSNEMFTKPGPHSLFYACPQYLSIYGKDHSHKSCNNRLTTVDYERMLNHLSNEVLQDMEILDATNLSWEDHGVSYKVLSCRDGKYVVSVLNKKAIAR